ncbi:MAG: DUF1801 domain-containing protein [Myxococcales bacterium]|nr:DUF1801 domain-containing protein [Myxococcales bacterium]
MRIAFDDPAVAEAFAAFGDDVRDRLLELRQLIFETARATAAVGALSESLKWGQPSYAPTKARIGSPVRLGVCEGEATLFFHCQTKLVSSFRLQHGNALRFEGNRAVVVGQTQPLPRQALADCIATALTYHLRR